MMSSLFRSMSVGKVLLLPILVVCWEIRDSTGFLPTFPSIVGKQAAPGAAFSVPTNICKGNRFQQGATTRSDEGGADEIDGNGGDGDGEDKDLSDEEQSPPQSSLEMGDGANPTIQTSTMRIDDGGSNLTDRFKYKVHALMGDYDPQEGMSDDEGQSGNIMNAFVDFPTKHVFDVVGRVSSVATDEEVTSNGNGNNDEYADQVKSIIFENTGDETMSCEVIPRGKNFIKVRCEAMVESTTMINNIYDELGAMESTVMKF